MRPNRQNLNLSLLAALCVSLLPRLLVDALVDDDRQWQGHDVSMHASVCALVFLVAWMLPYRCVAGKCVAFSWIGFEAVSLIESIFRLFEIAPMTYTIAWQCTAAVSLSVWYFLRSYKFCGDVLDDTNIFICRLKPRGVQDVFLAMIGKAGLGSVAIYHNGYLWHYRRGVLQRDEGFKNRSRYVAFSVCEPDQMTIHILNNMVGSKWSPMRNCITMLYATAKTGAPLFKHWR